jgi:hypothetical protein
LLIQRGPALVRLGRQITGGHSGDGERIYAGLGVEPVVLGGHQRSRESPRDLLARVNGVVRPVQRTRQSRSIGNRRGNDQEPSDHDPAEQAQHHGHHKEPARPPEAMPAPQRLGGPSAGGTRPVQAAQVPAGRAAVGTARRGNARPRWSRCCHATSGQLLFARRLRAVYPCARPVIRVICVAGLAEEPATTWIHPVDAMPASAKAFVCTGFTGVATEVCSGMPAVWSSHSVSRAEPEEWE